jgi:predicted nucleotidyltransferase
MQTLSSHPIDVATEMAVDAFSKKVSSLFAVRNLILFGSRARGEFRPDSDADLAVLLSGPSGRFMAAKLAMADIAFDVLLDTGVRIEALPIWEDEWTHPDDYRNPYLLHNIAHDGIVIR